MKRGGPLTRRTLLAAGSPMARSTALTRVSRMRRTARLRAERRPVTAEETRARALVAARSGGRCEGCGRAPASEWAHRVGRAHGGLWCPYNGLALCGPAGCHHWSHMNVAAARSVGWILRSDQDPASTPGLLTGQGWVLLDPSGAITPTERGAA